MPIKQSISGHLAGLIAYSIFGFNIIVCKDLTSGGFIPPSGDLHPAFLRRGLAFLAGIPFYAAGES